MQKQNQSFPPEWSKGLVWYQIFPERFRNGDTTNNPALKDQVGCWPHELIEPWEVHPWNSDWYKLQNYEKENGKDIWYNITRRRYGGDLQGIIDKIGYLKELGVQGIYLNPVFVAPSHHKYDISYYHHIDPNFGPDPDGDWQIIKNEVPDDPETWKWTAADSLALKLIETVHKNNMYIIFDGVFNHMGYNNFALEDIRLNQKNSRFTNWFTITSWEDKKKGTTFEYEGWWGIKDMPELREDSTGIVTGPREYIYSITQRWMDPNGNGDISKGIDGWRLDVANYVGHPFWKKWRTHVKSINSEAFITAEIIENTDYLEPYLQGDEFDAAMNYNFAFIASEFFVNNKKSIPVTEFDSLLNLLLINFPGDVHHSMQNLIGSHDTHRAASRMVNRDKGSWLDKSFFFEGNKAFNKNVETRKPTKREYNRLKQLITFQMTFPGAPMIYYGDETGMWGAHDPCCRKPMVWDDIKYFPEKLNANGSEKKPDTVEVNQDIYTHYKKLIQIRKELPSLQKGSYETILKDDHNNLYGFQRQLGDDKVYVIFNKSSHIQTFDLKTENYSKFVDMLNGGRYNADKEGVIGIEMKPYGTSIIKPEK